MQLMCSLLAGLVFGFNKNNSYSSRGRERQRTATTHQPGWSEGLLLSNRLNRDVPLDGVVFSRL